MMMMRRPPASWSGFMTARSGLSASSPSHPWLPARTFAWAGRLPWVHPRLSPATAMAAVQFMDEMMKLEHEGVSRQAKLVPGMQRKAERMQPRLPQARVSTLMLTSGPEELAGG